MSGNPNSLLAKYSTCHLNIAVKREACPLNLAPTSSTTATLAMGDAIACALINKRGFKPADFAKYHPGGSLGRKLLLQVKDLMHADNIPIIREDDKVSEVIIQISKARLGIAVVLDDSKILGVITDGDVRRAMQHHQQVFFSLKAKDIMSTEPKSILQTAKLSEAERMFQQYNIHTLLVVDENNELQGIIDSLSCI
jgi:arabinose-5-phosphate isomerase